MSLLDFLSKNKHDEVKTPQIFDKDNETGMDRLRAMFAVDQYGYRSREATMISQAGMFSFLGGVIIGGIQESRKTFVSFIENNQATKFANHMDAKRQLSRKMYLSFMKGGWNLGWQICLFSVSFTTVMTTISVYRDKESILDYVAAGATTGGFFRLYLGPKGFVAGSAVGGFLGGITGGIVLLILKIGGVTMKDLRDFSKNASDARNNMINENRKKYMLKEHTDLSGKTGDDTQFINLDAADAKQ